MRNMLIILMLMAFSACKTDKVPVDNEYVDKDFLTDADNVLTESDISSSDSDTEDRDNETTDVDMDTDSVECLDLRYNENTIKTNFPFKDKDGKPTLCRPGCDTPTETDPQCVRNIWEWDNWSEYQVYLEAEKEDSEQEWERECYPWPCKLPDMKANSTLESFNSKCDRWLTVNGFDASMGTIWSHGMSDGVAGMILPHSGRVVEYDPEKDEYSTLGQSHLLSFNEKRYVIQAHDREPDLGAFYKNFVISVLRKDSKYYYEFIYDSESADEEFTGPPFAGGKWSLIQMGNRTTGKKSFKYASSKDWQWQNIEGIKNYTGEGNIVGDHLSFITNDREIYYCNLTKYPKHINDCKKINRLNSDGTTYELGHSPRIDMENEYRLIYNIDLTQTFVEVDLTDMGNPKYKEYEIPKNKELFAGFTVDAVRGNKVVYEEMFNMGSGTLDAIGCFYRFDKKKSYCPAEKTFSTSPDSLMGYNTFWGKWHLWKGIGRPAAFMRDWECYCNETGVCPLEE